MPEKKQSECVAIKKALFFPQDFRKLQGNYIICIRDGFIMNLDGNKAKKSRRK